MLPFFTHAHRKEPFTRNISKKTGKDDLTKLVDHFRMSLYLPRKPTTTATTSSSHSSTLSSSGRTPGGGNASLYPRPKLLQDYLDRKNNTSHSSNLSASHSHKNTHTMKSHQQYQHSSTTQPQKAPIGGGSGVVSVGGAHTWIREFNGENIPAGAIDHCLHEVLRALLMHYSRAAGNGGSHDGGAGAGGAFSHLMYMYNQAVHTHNNNNTTSHTTVGQHRKQHNQPPNEDITLLRGMSDALSIHSSDALVGTQHQQQQQQSELRQPNGGENDAEDDNTLASNALEEAECTHKIKEERIPESKEKSIAELLRVAAEVEEDEDEDEEGEKESAYANDKEDASKHGRRSHNSTGGISNNNSMMYRLMEKRLGQMEALVGVLRADSEHLTGECDELKHAYSRSQHELSRSFKEFDALQTRYLDLVEERDSEQKNGNVNINTSPSAASPGPTTVDAPIIK